MTNSNASIKPVASDDTVIRIGKATFTSQQSLEHGAALYDNMYLIHTQLMDVHNELGQILIQHRALYKSDKLFGQFLAKGPLACMSRQDRSDTVFVASNWAKIRKINNDGSLDSLGVSAIRKRLKASDKPKAPTSAGNVSEGKAKPEAEPTVGPSDTKTEAKPLTADSLAKQVKILMKEHGITQAAFNKAMKA
jgi:hypothetical protein